MSKMQTRIIATVAAGIFLLLGALDFSTASAETVKTTIKTRVMKRPGESGKVVLRVPAGTSMDVLGREGRWVRVRVKGRTGYVTRTSISTPRQARKPANKSRRRPFVEGRSKRRGWTGGAPSDRVGADAAENDDGDDEGDDDDDDDDFDDDGDDKPRAKAAPAEKTRVAARDRDDDDDDDDFGDDDDDDDDDDEDDLDDDDDDRKKERTVKVTSRKIRLRSGPKSKARTVTALRRGQELTVIKESKSGRWLKVENEEGEVGWVRTKQVEETSGRSSTPMSGPGGGKSAKRAGARLGYAALSTAFDSNGVGELAAYDISAAAATLIVGGEYMYRYSPKYTITLDGSYTGMRASPGIRFESATGQEEDISFLSHEVRVGVAGGYNINPKSGMAFFVRGGFHYNKFSVGQQDNLAQLPSEIFQGATVGAYLDVPRYSPKLGFRIGADAMLLSASRNQTGGLEDGDNVDSVFGAWVLANVLYQWRPNLQIEAGYRLTYATTEWSSDVAAPRAHAATEANRKDIAHLLSVGVGRYF